MSKASEWAAAMRKAKAIEPEPLDLPGSFLRVRPDDYNRGPGVWIYSSPRGDCLAVLSADDAVTLARWIIEMYGETGQ